ncbi:MAG: aminodeoxychorismate synthase component I [Chloroflexi bacterium]|nr:aminodeoxychorismate synthase component I [Chloroflexota bacterium]
MAPTIEPTIDIIPYPSDTADLFEPFANDGFSIFLDSSLQHERLGRYSFISSDPKLMLESKDERIIFRQGKDAEAIKGNPFKVLQEVLSRNRFQAPEGLPPFFGGAAGYFGYELAHFVERLPRAADDVGVPDLCLGFYDWCLAIDHARHEAYLICLPWRPNETHLRREFAGSRRKWVLDKLSGAGTPPSSRDMPLRLTSPIRSNFSRGEYTAAVQRVKDYIAAGDIYQANLSQRFQAPVEGSKWSLYRRLRSLNPAPFSAYLNLGDTVVASSSPERFLQLSGDKVETRPIKGTRPRGKSRAEDELLARELLASPKDRAENVMIVDLLRNDIGRVCQIGSVHVPELAALESYATVFHLVSTVAGTLLPGKDAVDLLMACWPGGSITGAPKIRAMEIISELEKIARGVYCGSAGYISLAGDMDTSIAIRTFTFKQEMVYFQAGGGIVSDSDPEAEYQETLDKARGLMLALEQVQAAI